MGDSQSQARPRDVLGTLEERKIQEIEHSRVRRAILQGCERLSDTHSTEQPDNLDALIRDKAAFEYHFSNIKYYSIARSSEAYQQSWLRERCRPGVKVLDFACGSGENGIFAAKCGAEVVGIDISPEGVDNANLNAGDEGVAERCRFEVMDGERMTFPDNRFDIVVEYGALHHVELDRAMAELSRVLKPGGEMICTEALRHNPLIHWYRRRTPHLRTAWEVEHILGVEHLDIFRRYFDRVDVRFFHLLALAAVPFRRTALFRPLRGLLDYLDNRLLRSRCLGKYAWMMVVTLREPRKRRGAL